MQKAKNLKEYREELRESLDNDFLRTTLDNFAIAYKAGRANAFKDMRSEERRVGKECRL